MTTQAARDQGGWTTALDEFLRAELSAGLAETTVDREGKQLRALARALGLASPWQVQPEHLLSYLSNHSGTSETIKHARQTIRKFYQWAVDAGHLQLSPAPAAPVPSTPQVDRRWRDALDAFETAQGAAGIRDSTVAARMAHLARFAESIQLSPWRVSYEDIRSWLDRSASSRHTMLTTRTSIRAFYRWATAAGRILEDPSAEPTYVTRQAPVPESWRPELDAYRAYFRAIGRPRTSVQIRMAQLNRFARDNASMAPLDATFDDLVDWLGEKRWAAETRRAHRSALRSFYGWALDSGRIQSSPAEKLPVVRRGTHLPRPALEEEYKKALAFSSPRERVALVLAAELGLRRMEVAQVHSKDLMHRNGEWTLTVHGKGAHQRSLPLAPNHVTMLRALPEGFVFPGQDHGHMSPHYMGKLISRLLPAGVTMHALRHRFATRIYAIDRDVFAVQQLLGHASPATTQVYVRIEEASMRRLVAAVAS